MKGNNQICSAIGQIWAFISCNYRCWIKKKSLIRNKNFWTGGPVLLHALAIVSTLSFDFGFRSNYKCFVVTRDWSKGSYDGSIAVKRLLDWLQCSIIVIYEGRVMLTRNLASVQLKNGEWQSAEQVVFHLFFNERSRRLLLIVCQQSCTKKW